MWLITAITTVQVSYFRSACYPPPLTKQCRLSQLRATILSLDIRTTTSKSLALVVRSPTSINLSSLEQAHMPLSPKNEHLLPILPFLNTFFTKLNDFWPAQALRNTETQGSQKKKTRQVCWACDLPSSPLRSLKRAIPKLERNSGGPCSSRLKKTPFITDSSGGIFLKKQLSLSSKKIYTRLNSLLESNGRPFSLLLKTHSLHIQVNTENGMTSQFRPPKAQSSLIEECLLLWRNGLNL